MPPELVTALAQFPVVAVVFLAAWVVLRWAERRSDLELKREQERSRDLANAKDDQIAWLTVELTRLRDRNTKLQNQLDEGRQKPAGGGT